MSTDKFRNKYRIASNRAQWWNYGNNATYFITICIANRKCHFGNIGDASQLSEIGQIADRFWNEIPEYFQNASLREYVVMPNHIHGIIVINKNKIAVEGELINLGGGITQYKNPMLNDSLSRILNWYKGRCTFEIRKICADFSWQPRFHDRIIRNQNEYCRIANYIINNPANWRN